MVEIKCYAKSYLHVANYKVSTKKSNENAKRKLLREVRKIEENVKNQIKIVRRWDKAFENFRTILSFKKPVIKMSQ